MEQIVHTPEPKHDCGPNEFGIIPDLYFVKPGTIIECEPPCKKSWVAVDFPPGSGWVGVRWRPEGIIARRRRLGLFPFNKK